MPKIRTIKPEFWTDGAMVRLSPLARLLFIGSWNFTLCDHGHLPDDAVRLKLQILPMENCDIDALLAELIDAGRIDRIEVDGRSYLHVRRFTDHQRIETRWNSRCPACPRESSPDRAEPHTTSREETGTRATSRKEGKGREGKGTDEGTRKRGTRIPGDFTVTDEMRAWAADKGFAHLPLEAITEEFFDYWVAVAGQKGVKLDWAGTWRNWIRRKAEDAKVRPIRAGRAANDQRPEGW